MSRDIQVGDSNGMCSCGRIAVKIHCPYCGSATIRALTSRRNIVTLHDGTQAMCDTYNCRICGEFFTDLDRQRCSAPPPRQGISKRAVKALEFMEETGMSETMQNAMLQMHEMRAAKGNKNSIQWLKENTTPSEQPDYIKSFEDEVKESDKADAANRVTQFADSFLNKQQDDFLKAIVNEDKKK